MFEAKNVMWSPKPCTQGEHIVRFALMRSDDGNWFAMKHRPWADGWGDYDHFYSLVLDMANELQFVDSGVRGIDRITLSKLMYDAGDAEDLLEQLYAAKFFERLAYHLPWIPLPL